MKLFIDDERTPHPRFGVEAEGWHIARTYEEAIAFIEQHKPQRIAFDHDLGRGEKTGMDIAKYLVERDMRCPNAGYITQDFIFTSQSANPEGRRNIMLLLHGYVCDKFYK